MILIFDLDDTLYPERTYVESGFHAVARWGEARFGWPAQESFERMRALFDHHGRGRVFDLWLKAQGARPTRSRVDAAVRVYRHHDPDIQLPEPHGALLERLTGLQPLYLVTDGHKVVQEKKIAALGIAPLFTGIYITHRYGRAAAKPSPRCFELIRRRAKADWADMVYVGDDPAKDFVTLNRLGMPTIRVLTGQHAYDAAVPEFDAAHKIEQLTELPSSLEILDPMLHKRS
jgi:putative hydrolase of the HAD superfamily